MILPSHKKIYSFSETISAISHPNERSRGFEISMNIATKFRKVQQILSISRCKYPTTFSGQFSTSSSGQWCSGFFLNKSSSFHHKLCDMQITVKVIAVINILTTCIYSQSRGSGRIKILFIVHRENCVLHLSILQECVETPIIFLFSYL